MTDIWYFRPVLQDYRNMAELATGLNEILKGQSCTTMYSRRPGVLIFESELSTFEFIWEAGEFFLLPSQGRRGRKDIPRFQEIWGLKILEICPVTYDRSFIFHFQNGYCAWIKAWGHLGNFILFENDEVIDVFQRQFTSDWNAIIPKLEHAPTVGELVNAQEGWVKHNGQHFWIENGMKQGPWSILEMAKIYSHHRLKEIDFESKRNEILHQANQNLKNWQKTASSSQIQWTKIKSERPLSELADNFMAYLHEIPTHVFEWEVKDIYTEEKIWLTWKYPETPLIKAEKLYRKSKNRIKEVEILEKKIQECEEKIKYWERVKCQVLSAIEKKDLPFMKEENPRKQAENSSYYYQTEVEGYEIYIGKNAQGNHRLLREKANKNDWWFHAANVSGSHVVVRGNAIQTLPASVIHKASALAAWFSKSRQSQVVAVWMTRCKYVRIPKGAAPGEVIAQPVETIDIKPEKLI